MLQLGDFRMKQLLALVLLMVATAVGCQAWPFGAKERTSILTPAMRIAAIQETGAQANNTEDAEQTQLVEQLAMQIRSESDPIVRRAIQQNVAKFRTPLAREMLLAGLNDEDRDVRIVCCLSLALQQDARVVEALHEVLKSEPDSDVRMAAVDALGHIQTPESIAALAVAIEDRDPAMQYAGVRALKGASGQDLGNDVATWREYVAGPNPQIVPRTSVAERLQQWSPF